MDNIEKLLKKYELAKSETYKEIRAEALNYIVSISKSALAPERINGMLMLIEHIDGWVGEYIVALKKRKD